MIFELLSSLGEDWDSCIYRFSYVYYLKTLTVWVSDKKLIALEPINS